MQFSEANCEWQETPSWASFLIRCGFDWLRDVQAPRRIGLISMPCDSAGAGLVALGAMRHRLEINGANDLGAHYQRIESLARSGDTRARLLNRNPPRKLRGPYVVDGQYSAGMVWVKMVSSPDTRMTVSLTTAINWQFEAEAPVQVLCGDQIPYGQHYAELIEGGNAVDAANLMQSDSGVCLASRVTGGNSTRSALMTIRFKADGRVGDLSELLAVQDWSLGMISRVSFFNSRTEQLDRSTSQPRLVIADGDAAFLKVLERDEFQQSDVVGVMHRTVERDRLETLGERLAGLDQWYERDVEFLRGLPPSPHGIGVLLLRRR
jgi:hypothetical protein